MMHCSDKARARCPRRRCGGDPEHAEFPANSWCAGFNAGVAKALQNAIDLEPLISGIKAAAENLPELMRAPEVQAALEKLKEGSDGRP